MKKQILAMALITIIGLSIVSCVGNPPPEPPPPPPAQPQTPTATPTPTPVPSQSGLILDGASTYTVVKGDTLSEIAEKRYGQSNLLYFPLIRLANASVVSDPDVIEPGTSLVIPNLQSNLNSAGAKALLKTEMLSIAGHYDRHERPAFASQLRNLANKL